MIDLNLARKACGSEVVNLYDNVLGELYKNKIKIEERGRIGNTLFVKYKLPENATVKVTIYPEKKVSIHKDIGTEENVNYKQFQEKLREILFSSD